MEGADFVKQGYLLFEMLKYKITVLFPNYFLNLCIYAQSAGGKIPNQNEMWEKWVQEIQNCTPTVSQNLLSLQFHNRLAFNKSLKETRGILP